MSKNQNHLGGIKRTLKERIYAALQGTIVFQTPRHDKEQTTWLFPQGFHWYSDHTEPQTEKKPPQNKVLEQNSPWTSQINPDAWRLHFFTCPVRPVRISLWEPLRKFQEFLPASCYIKTPLKTNYINLPLNYIKNKGSTYSNVITS